MTQNLMNTTPPARADFTNAVLALRKRINYTVENVETIIGRLPANSVIVGGGVHIITAFNDSGTDTLDIGFKGGSATDDPNGLATLLDLSAVGFIALDELAATTNIVSSSDVNITYTYNGQNNNASAGDAIIVILYVPGELPT